MASGEWAVTHREARGAHGYGGTAAVIGLKSWTSVADYSLLAMTAQVSQHGEANLPNGQTSKDSNGTPAAQRQSKRSLKVS